MRRRLFEDLVVSAEGTQRLAWVRAVPVSIALHAAGLLALVMASLLAGEAPEPRPPSIPVEPGPWIAPASPPLARVVGARPPRAARLPRPENDRDLTPPPNPRVATPDEPGQDEAVPPDLPPPDVCLFNCGEGDRWGWAGDPRRGFWPGETTPRVPVPVGGRVKEPRRLKTVSPVYPELARRAGVRGEVVLQCVIDPEGRVRDVVVLRGHPLLDAAAVEAVRQWAYTPTLLNGAPVSILMTVTVTVRFVLRDGPRASAPWR